MLGRRGPRVRRDGRDGQLRRARRSLQVYNSTLTENVGVGAGRIFAGVDGHQMGDLFFPLDPEVLAPITLPSGRRGALPLPAGPCVDAVPAGMNLNPEGVPMIVDLRLLPRDITLSSDLGAIEL